MEDLQTGLAMARACRGAGRRWDAEWRSGNCAGVALAPSGVAAGRVLVVGAGKQGAFDAKGAIGDTGGADRAFTLCLKERPAPDAAVEVYLAREIKFDPDVWIVEVEDRGGRNFLDVVAA